MKTYAQIVKDYFEKEEDMIDTKYDYTDDDFFTILIDCRSDDSYDIDFIAGKITVKFMDVYELVNWKDEKLKKRIALAKNPFDEALAIITEHVDIALRDARATIMMPHDVLWG